MPHPPLELNRLLRYAADYYLSKAYEDLDTVDPDYRMLITSREYQAAAQRIAKSSETDAQSPLNVVDALTHYGAALRRDGFVFQAQDVDDLIQKINSN